MKNNLKQVTESILKAPPLEGLGRLLFLCLIISCTPQKQYFEESGSVFHTLYHIKYDHDKLLTEKIDNELADFNLSLNPFNPNSIISKVNRNEGVDVDYWFTTVFNKSKEVYDNSNGAFDPTVSPLINLWGFGFENQDKISEHTIDSLLQFVGFDKIHIENGRIVKEDPRIQLNFSAIAKGYASDVIASLLEKEGVENYLIEIGGEVAVKGKNPLGKCWQVGINKPEDDSTGINNEIENIVQLCNKSGLATSGNYRNFHVKDGKKYAHTINPKTGYPTDNNTLSVTIIASDCMTADAYATTFMVTGVDEASKIADKIKGLEYYIIYIDENGEMKKRFTIKGLR